MLNLNYELPSRKVLSNSLLSASYEHCVTKLRTIVVTTRYVAITTDGWTSINNEGFYAITAHFIDDDCKMKSGLLPSFKFVGQHTSENISEQIKKTLSEWQVDNKIVACVTDNAANMVKAVQLAKWWHVPCFAHSLNLIVQSSLPKITDTVNKVKSVVEFFKRSSSATEKLQINQKRMGIEVLKLKEDCPTRWNSTFDMLRRFLQNKEPVQSTMGILNIPSLPILSPEDWYIIENCCDILYIFNEMTTELSVEKNATLSKIAVLSKNLINYCLRLKNENFESVSVNNLVNKLHEEVTTRFKRKYRNIDLIWEAAFLDPRFKQHGFHEDDSFKQTKQNIIDKCFEIKEKYKVNTPTDESVEIPTSSTS
ncbi:E3 SUMO-protein ligase ZBED1-like [Diabrotica undecimpunctata]|uniref:E3 SUMO-protein ligase ZBED1-like n=1 Tax=Diabrotica undecimpunctata TaxID=50387 RepID=UPI003B635E33